MSTWRRSSTRVSGSVGSSGDQTGASTASAMSRMSGSVASARASPTLCGIPPVSCRGVAGRVAVDLPDPDRGLARPGPAHHHEDLPFRHLDAGDVHTYGMARSIPDRLLRAAGLQQLERFPTRLVARDLHDIAEFDFGQDVIPFAVIRNPCGWLARSMASVLTIVRPEADIVFVLAYGSPDDGHQSRKLQLCSPRGCSS